MQKIILLLGCVLSLNAFAQTPAKWSVSGNSITSGDFLGTTNNEDLIIKTNGNTAVKIKANGNFILKSLEGSGNGLVLFDNNGKLNPLVFSGDVNQVLLGDGTFGSVPAGLWSTGSGGKIYYNGGKVGIGTATPNFKLDVDGDMRVTQDLYLQGALIISDKIQTPKQMKAQTVIADSIIMDSTRAVYGQANFKGDVKITSKLNVNGNAFFNGSETVSGDIISGGSVYFAGGQKISYTPGTSSTPAILAFGGSTRPVGACYAPPAVGTPTYNQFQGLIQSFDNPTATTSIMNMGFDGTNAIVDLDGPTTAKIAINNNCSHEVQISNGVNGGKVVIGGGDGGDIDLLGGTSGDMLVGYGTNTGIINIASGANSGNVGISTGAISKTGVGTIFPLAKFEVQNDIPSTMTACFSKVESATQTRRIIFEPKLNFGDYNPLTQANDAGIFWTDGAGGAGRNQDAGFVIGAFPSSASGTTDFFGMRMTSKGAIGIGIAIPEAVVHIQNDFEPRGPIGLKVTANLPGFADQETPIAIQAEGTNDLNRTISSGKKSGTTYTENFAVFADGHVFARDIKVTLNNIAHGDYVFENSYQLMPLNDLETYVNANNHLPNVPSTAEVAKAKGINLGEMSEKQLVKIEELTLYIIELNKKLDSLESTVKDQEKEIKNLKNK
ncbi:MAG: hypothetical protein ACJ77K_16155 [Bacteroidia bacterium]